MILFLDIDGTLIPFGGPGPYRTYDTADAAVPMPPHPLLSRVDPSLGPRLLSLGCELVWATTWPTDEANAYVGRWLGLPALRSVEWPEDGEPESVPGLEPAGDLHWKTRPLLRWASGRGPFIWLDDEITDADRAWTSARHPAPVLLHRIDPGKGLTERDLRTLENRLGG